MPLIDNKIAAAQSQVLQVFAQEAEEFALAGGTALERYYLHHRFSWDLDFFSPAYRLPEIERLVAAFKKRMGRLTLVSELTLGGRAKVRFYSMPVRGASRPLKIDFVEDILTPAPVIKKFAGVRVYSAESIYLQKVAAIAGTRLETDQTGRVLQEGRQAPRDVFDLYMLSKKVLPLHRFLKKTPALYRKGLVHWYRTFSRHDLKMGLLDLEIYGQAGDSREIVTHLEKEIKTFIQDVLNE